jgi:hypothetical protein
MCIVLKKYTFFTWFLPFFVHVIRIYKHSDCFDFFVKKVLCKLDSLFLICKRIYDII